MSVSVQPPPASHEIPPPPPPPPPPPSARRRRGLWIGLVAAAVVVTGVVVALVLMTRPAPLVDVSGTVTDARTGVTIEDVSIKGGETAATTDADGAFTVQAQPDAVLGFSARGYETAEVAVAEDLSVELAPVSLTGTVTSAMTGTGLAATATRDGTELGTAGPDGSLTVYAVASGDRLVVTADGYLPGEVTLGDDPFAVNLLPQFPTSQAQVQQWVTGGEYGKALDWVLRDDLDALLGPAGPFGQSNVDQTVADFPEVFAAGRSTVTLAGNDFVDAYVVEPGRSAEAMFGWTDSGTAFIVDGQTVVSGPSWSGNDVIITMWWYDPLLVISYTDTTDEGEDLITAVMRGQGLDIHTFDQTDSTAVPADG